MTIKPQFGASPAAGAADQLRRCFAAPDDSPLPAALAEALARLADRRVDRAGPGPLPQDRP